MGIYRCGTLPPPRLRLAPRTCWIFPAAVHTGTVSCWQSTQALVLAKHSMQFVMPVILSQGSCTRCAETGDAHRARARQPRRAQTPLMRGMVLPQELQELPHGEAV